MMGPKYKFLEDNLFSILFVWCGLSLCIFNIKAAIPVFFMGFLLYLFKK